MDVSVCNVNSFGNINYKIPVSNKKNDYETSTEKYLRHIQPPTQVEFYSDEPMISESSRKRDYNSVKQYYQTTYDTTWVSKYMKPNAGQMYKRAGRCSNMHFLSKVQEKMFKNPPRPIKGGLTETHDQYDLKHHLPEFNCTPPARTLCPLKSLSGDEQERVCLESDTGLFKLLDPYVSSTRLAHFPFTQEQISKGSASKTLTFYSSKNLPLCTIKEPVYDKVQFKKPCRNRVIPQKQCTVPHVGMRSEYSARYISPISSPLFTQIFDPGLEYPGSIQSPDMRQTMCPPGMYCTEMCHMGTGWRPSAVVNPHKDDKRHVTIHEPCSKKDI